MTTAQSVAPQRVADILVVDDDPDIRTFVTAALTYDGYRVREARDGQDALDRITDRRPDLLVLDLNMPGVTGWDVIERLQAARMPLPTVIMTAAYRARDEAARYGAAGYLGKPFDLETLFATVERAL